MVSIELWMVKIIGFMLVRSHQRLKNSVRVCGRSDLQKLKNATSMPAETRHWQKSIDFVDGLKGKLQDDELAVIKRYVELVRVSKRPDSSVPQTRGRGIKDEPPSTAS